MIAKYDGVCEISGKEIVAGESEIFALKGSMRGWALEEVKTDEFEESVMKLLDELVEKGTPVERKPGNYSDGRDEMLERYEDNKNFKYRGREYALRTLLVDMGYMEKSINKRIAKAERLAKA